MEHIGSYDGKNVYRVWDGEKIPADTTNLYVDGTGAIRFGGYRIGRLNGLKVVEYDMGIYTRGEAQKKAAKKKEKAVPAPTCVATTVAIGPNGELSGADEFFARVALDIEETLKHAGDFKSEVESWTFV